MRSVINPRHQILYKENFAYCAHPHIAALANGEWLVVFNRSMRRPLILHPPEDPLYYNIMMRSGDQGASWNVPRVVPNYDWHGVECAGLIPLRSGELLLNQWRFHWYPLEEAKKLTEKVRFFFPQDWLDEAKVSGELDMGYIPADNPNEMAPWARADGGTYVHRSVDGGRTWVETVEIDTQPYPGGYGMRGAVELPDGELLLPLSDIPNYQTVFVARSSDGGRTWGRLVEAARMEDRWFEEPSILALPDGRVLMVLRDNRTHYLYQTSSADAGASWSVPEQLPIWGYPAHLLALPDGRILCVYGYRRPPYGIRAMLSYDQGRSWDVDNLLVIRDDLPNRDLGYPSSVLAGDGQVLTVYYGQDADGVTCIQATRYQLEE